MSLEQVIIYNMMKERLINEVSNKFNLPLEVCNMIYDYSEQHKDEILKSEDLPKRPKFKDGDIYDPNITPNEKPFYKMEFKDK